MCIRDSIASFAALYIRFDFQFNAIPKEYMLKFEHVLPFNIAFTPVSYTHLDVYKRQSTIYVDGIAYTPQVRNNRRIVKLPNGNAQSAVVYRYNAVSYTHLMRRLFLRSLNGIPGPI